MDQDNRKLIQSSGKKNKNNDSHMRMSLDSKNAGFDFMTEARDFNNIITNLKVLLHKNGVESHNHSKSFMTIQQRPISS